MFFEISAVGVPCDATAGGIVRRRRSEVCGIVHVHRTTAAVTGETLGRECLEPVQEWKGHLSMELLPPLRRWIERRMVVAWLHTRPVRRLTHTLAHAARRGHENVIATPSMPGCTGTGTPRTSQNT